VGQIGDSVRKNGQKGGATNVGRTMRGNLTHWPSEKEFYRKARRERRDFFNLLSGLDALGG
ncbi:MAG: hypothetical protein KKB13_05165, partial [Chloroflexi bacterium]|nr:hypothetical protein [Chloroflexota bacterium]